MHLYIKICLAIVVSVQTSTTPSKIVGLVTARNEKIMITQCLKGLSLFTDAIIVLDDASTDNTVDLIESLAHECKIEKIIKKSIWHRDEPGDRNKLLQAGREIGGTHFICFDSDEMFTSNLTENNSLRNYILGLTPGNTVSLTWIQLWRSTDWYRFDNSVWTNNYKDFIFCDDGICSYQSEFIHSKRTPNNLQGSNITLSGYDYGVMHFQFVNWENLLIKQAWYRCLERIRNPDKSVALLNQVYGQSKDERNLHCSASPEQWFTKYPFFDKSIFNKPEEWRKEQILSWFKQYGTTPFAGLDIWDIDWGI